jgi:hypothetical protein
MARALIMYSDSDLFLFAGMFAAGAFSSNSDWSKDSFGQTGSSVFSLPTHQQPSSTMTYNRAPSQAMQQQGFSNLASAPMKNLFAFSGANALAPSPAFGGAPSPAFGGAPSPAFGGAPSPAFGGAPSPAFGGAPSPAFGGAPSPAFGGAPSLGFNVANTYPPPHSGRPAMGGASLPGAFGLGGGSPQLQNLQYSTFNTADNGRVKPQGDDEDDQ